jgi:hypothetical protein
MTSSSGEGASSGPASASAIMRDGSSTVVRLAARNQSVAVVTVMRQIQVENAASPRKLRIAVASLTQTSCAMSSA